jgi:hypothetical protein
VNSGICEVANFEAIIKVAASGKVNIPGFLAPTLNSIAVYTGGEVMSSTFKGTFLHHAFLPVTHPTSLQGAGE